MKRTFPTLLLLAFAFSSGAQGSNIEKEIREMDQKNAAVIVRPDSAALVELLAREFTINRTTGTVVTGRTKTIELFQKGTVVYNSFSAQTEFVMIKNPSLAVRMGSEVAVLGGASELKGQPVKRRFSHLWTKETGKWQLLARHANNACTP